jgi:enoyl-CoA hydratase
MTDLVLTEDRGPVRVLTMNRPEKLNALSGALVDSLSIGLAEAAERAETRVVILAGAGRSFCAGYDLSEDGGESDIEAGLSRSLDRLLELFDHPKPIIAQIQGHCLAGGCDLMMMCDLAVASEDAVFGQPEIRFGAGVVAYVMPWLIGARRAKELLFTGVDKIPAVEAERIGLVNRVVPKDQLEEETMRLAGALALVDPFAMQMTKRAINWAWEAAGFRDALRGGLELGAMIETTKVPEREEFERIAAERGLAEAIRWRDERFES